MPRSSKKLLIWLKIIISGNTSRLVSSCRNYVRSFVVFPYPVKMFKHVLQLMFCSIRCRENAFEKFHRIECQIFSMLMDPDEEDVSMMTWATVRILLIATKQGQELDQMMSHPVYKFQLKKKCRPNPNEKLQLQDYSSIFYHGQFSCANKFKDFGSELSLNPFLAVARWMYFLKQTSYFGKEGKNQVKFNCIL